MKRQMNRMNRGDRAGNAPVEIDHLIRDDRAELLRNYRSGEGGEKRAAALLLVAGDEAARGATGLLASGLLGAKGVWIATALLGFAGVGIVGSGIWKGKEPEQNEAFRQPVAPQEGPVEFTMPVTVESIDSEPVIPKPEERGAVQSSGRGEARGGSEGRLQEAESATAESSRPEVDRQEEIRTRITIELPE